MDMALVTRGHLGDQCRRLVGCDVEESACFSAIVEGQRSAATVHIARE